MPSAIFYNGKFYGADAPVIPLNDRSVFFGDAVYDALIGRNGKLYLADEHIRRLEGNARALNIPFFYSSSELRDILYNVAKVSKLHEYFIYVQLSRCSDERVHAFPDTHKSALLVTASPFSLAPQNTRLRLITEPDRRYGFCNLKTVNLLPAVLASRRAAERACDEAVFHRNGNVTECAHSNISILKDGGVITHPNCEKILPGIARERMIFTCKSLGIKVDERPFSLEELFSADEVILTSTTKICLAASEIDGRAVGGKDEKTLDMLQNSLFSEYANWTM